MTVRVLRSSAKRRNPNIIELDRKSGEHNLAWIQRAMGKSILRGGKNQSLLVLVGGNDPLSFHLRIAQSHVRHDLSPSAWSHVVFLPSFSKVSGESSTLEISLMPPLGFGPFGYPVPNNGIQHGRLGVYQSPDLFPNIALFAVPVESSSVEASLEGMRFQRSILDCPQLILNWLGYCWGVGAASSPLASGYGIPAAAVLEAAFAANGFDLTPGLESRSSCPEAIWQAANWWQDYYAKRGGGKPIRGAFTSKHELVPDSRYDGAPGSGGKKGRSK